jgi:predicted nucleotide-binding protein
MTAAAATTSAIADAAAAAAANDAASAPTPEQPAKPLRLRGSRADAMRDIQNQAKIGQAIRNQRLRDQRELDEARREKQEWVQRTTELLESLFNQTIVAEAFNDWVPTILPEYAEFGMFVELFNDEMRHRLGRLQSVLKSLHQIPEPPPIGGVTMPAETMNAPAVAASVATAPASRNPQLDAPPAAPQAAKPATIIGSGLFVQRTADNAARDAIAQFLARFGLKLQLCDRTAPDARPFSDELEAQTSARFVLILAPPPAEQNSADGEALFELGVCVGRLGAGRVIVLHRGGEAQPDRFGVIHVVLDNGDGWQLQLARHLRRGGVEVDLNKLV